MRYSLEWKRRDHFFSLLKSLPSEHSSAIWNGIEHFHRNPADLINMKGQPPERRFGSVDMYGGENLMVYTISFDLNIISENEIVLEVVDVWPSLGDWPL